MPWGSLSDRVILKSVGEYRAAVVQSSQTADELLGKARQIVRAHRIDGNENDQLGWLRAGRLAGHGSGNNPRE
jgi:hypothetical protein